MNMPASIHPATKPAPLLSLENITTGYGRKQILFDVSIDALPGEIVALIGHNGAGKTTALKAVFGLLPVWSGSVKFEGQPITNAAPSDNVGRGLVYLPQEHFVFADLTVADNLAVGGITVSSAEEVERRKEWVFNLMPVLRQRGRQLAGTLSGGERRMLSLGMAMMMQPRMLLLDEPSLGLAPSLVERMMDTIKQLALEGNLTVLLVEQNVRQALRISDRVYVMRTGRIILEEDSATMAARGQWWDLF